MISRLAALVAAGVLVVTGLATGPANAASGWVAKSPSRIVNSNTVRLVGGNTSVETSNLDIPVQAGDVISFRYVLQGGAECVGGAPRVFVETQGVYTNSWDQNQPNGKQCGSNGVVTFTVPSNGRIGAAGVVYDNGKPGQVLVSNLTVDGRQVSFTGDPLVRVTPKAPTATQPECGTKRGTLTVPSQRGVEYWVQVGRFSKVWKAGDHKVRPGLYRVDAKAKDGYELRGRQEWARRVNEAEACPSPSPTPTVTPTVTVSPTPTDNPDVREVTPEAPKLTQATCDDKTASVTIPKVAGVVYKNGSGKELEQGTTYSAKAGSITVTAEAADGYTLADGAETEWTLVVSETPDCPTATPTTTTHVTVVNNIPVPAKVDTGLGGLAR